MKYQKRMGIFWGVVFFSLFLSNHALAGNTVAITSFSPQGVVKGVRQATVIFSEPMVAFGDPRLGDPFTVQCPAKGQGRWIDTHTWSYDFAADLPGGVECEFRLQEGVKALSGTDISGQKNFRFSTGGPAVVRSVPYEGNEQIDERQIFVLYLDASPREASLTGNVFFSAFGIKERIGINIIAGNERRKILKSINHKGDERLVVLVQARQAFPDSAVVKLIWGQGVASESGIATEKDQVLSFRTREPFRAEFSCTREKADRACIPLLPVGLRFTAPIPMKLAEQIVITGPKEKKWPGKISDNDRRRGIVSYLTFPGPFPEKSKLTLRLPGEIKDEAGRILTNADKFPLPVTTDVYPPLAKFAARFGIIEAKGDRLLPVTIRNIERQMQGRLLKIDEKAPTPLVEEMEGAAGEQGEGSTPAGENTGAKGGGVAPGAAKAGPDGAPAFTGLLTGKMQRIGADQDVKVIEWLRKIAATEYEVPILDRQAPNLNFPGRKQENAFEVVGIPLPGPGFYIVELESRILGTHYLAQPSPLFIPAAALTTDMAAHFKWGREYSLVWVTSLEKGTPVAGAAVVIRDCKGKAIWQGKTDPTGVALIKTHLPGPDDLSRCSGKVNYREAPHALINLDGGLFVFVRSNGDMTFTHSSWNEGIEPWRFQLPMGGYSGEEGVVAHTILDRPLFRTGETAHMKHILRTHTSGGFALLPPAKRPDVLAIQHLGSDQTYRLPLRWHGNGSADTDWKIPENARLGTYELTLMKSKSPQDKTSADERRWRSGSFRVEEFRVPLMKAVIQVPVKPLVNVRETPLDLSVSYLSGGGASLLPIRLRAEVQLKTITFKDYEDFSFTGSPLKEGISPVSGRDDLEEGQDAAATEEPETQTASNKPFKLPTQELKLDNQGALRASLRDLPKVTTARDIHVEMEFKDPNGEIQTTAARIPLYPSRLAVGIRPDSWTAAQDKLNYKVAVVDLQGKPAPNVEATVDLYRQQTYSHRVRLVGGFYAYKNTREVRKIGRHCQGRTDAMGLLTCQGPSTVSGSVILRAEARDESGFVSAANYDLWIAGKDDWWFEGGNDDRIDVLPEKKKYEPGDKAKFQVRMPFREATALITVEREGILDVYTKRLSGKSPMVEIPIKKHYAPNVFVSVLVVRGRVGAAQPTAIFDPGKPAYKLGVTEIRVGGQAHQLNVQVVPERTVYKVRDTINVRIKVKGPADRPLPKGGAVVIAAVDKGLLQLAPNDSWRLLTAMMQRRDYEIRTATAQAMVVGKRHFGQKSLSHGGGGGRQFTRELFDTLLFWQGSLTLDARGEATVRIPLNDSLTGFRIVAIATAGTGLFGTGEADVQTSQDLMILSGLPPLVREGDRYQAVFTVRNTSDHDMKIEGRLTVRGPKVAQEQEPRQEMIPPGAARDLAWWITVPPDAAGLEYEATVKEQGGGSGNDRLKVVQKVTPAVPIRTVQAILTQIHTPVAVPIEKPADAEAGRGGINVQIKPVLAASLSGVRDYMDHYAYTCLEQKVSRAVVLKNKALWQATMAQLPSYLDSDGLLKYFPIMRQGSDSLTAYVLAIASEGGYEIPAYLRDRMTAGLRLFVEGRVIRYGALATADLAIRKLSALEALSRYGQANAKLLTSIPIDPNLWPTSALLDWINILQRLTDIPQREEKLKEGQQILRARMNLQGTRMTFSTEGMDQLWWLMASSDGNAVRSVLSLMNLEGWRDDLPRLAAGALGRMRQGHWDTTTTNAWGILAMDKFSARYEKTPVGGTTNAALNGKTRSVDWQKAPAGGTLSFNWPTGKETLQVTHSGAGAPWATIGATAALRLTKPLSSGFHVTRTVTKLVDDSDTAHSSSGTGEKGRGSSRIASENNGSLTKLNVGDIVRVRLDMEAQTDMTWVVLNDPIPAGASILRTGLGGDSLLLSAGEKTRGFAQEAFTERSQEAFRVYYEYVPKGKWSTEYTMRLNNEGVFQMPTSRLEALYAPEMFGETPVRPLTVTGMKQP